MLRAGVTPVKCFFLQYLYDHIEIIIYAWIFIIIVCFLFYCSRGPPSGFGALSRCLLDLCFEPALVFSVIHHTVCPMSWSLQLAARLDLVHDHPRFAPSSSLAGATQTFSPEQSAPFTAHIQDFSTILDPHNHFLSSQRPPKDEDFSFVLEEAVVSLRIRQEVAAASSR